MPFFQESNSTTVNSSNFIEMQGPTNVVNIGTDIRKGQGIGRLCEFYLQHEAIHDSDSRGPLGCHPGTREEYIRNITGWGRRDWKSAKRAFLMTGPAGAGKSAIARTCAQELKASGNLGASFFFYRPSRWNDPKKFIPTLVYQLTTRYPAYRDSVDAIILENPLVLDKAIDVQFLELLVKPLRQLNVNGRNVEADLVIIVDGLDECANVNAQTEIINLVTKSVHEETTPFLWAFFSRPEPPITSAFSSETATNISWTLPLTLSGTANSDIEAYFRGSFQMIRAKYRIPASVTWPLCADIHRLVSQSAGLFVYAVTAIRYIDGFENGTSRLRERLGEVLELKPRSKGVPFSALDQLYLLLMMQIPPGVLSDTMSLLRLDQSAAYRKFGFKNDTGKRGLQKRTKIDSYCSALGFSTEEFYVAIGNLYSVLEVIESEDRKPTSFRFYHRSFLDFLLDQKRSRKYFVHSTGVHQRCLERVIRVLSGEPLSYGFPLQAFFTLVEEHNGILERDILQQLSQIDWRRCCDNKDSGFQVSFTNFIKKIPVHWLPWIIRPSRDNTPSFFHILKSHLLRRSFGFHLWKLSQSIWQQMPAMLSPRHHTAKAYFLGLGEKKLLIERDHVRARWRVVSETILVSESESILIYLSAFSIFTFFVVPVYLEGLRPANLRRIEDTFNVFCGASLLGGFPPGLRKRIGYLPYFP